MYNPKIFFLKTILLLGAFFICISLCGIPFAEAVIIDHNCTDISKIPDYWINKAKHDFRISYGHTSHGSQIITGMEVLRSSLGSLYDFNHDGSNGALSIHDSEPSGDLGNPDRSTWAAKTRELLNNPNNDRNLIMWSWCGQVSSAGEDDINTYLTLMSQLEHDFPSVTFIYMTGHLDGTGEGENLHLRNNQIRNYCIANDKILFDFADIESYDPDGNYFLNRGADDACNYNGGNWADEWCSSHKAECTSCSCAHSRCLNCQMKGRAFWWMMATLAGWNQSHNVSPTLTFPHIASGGGWETDICIINTSGEHVLDGIFKAYDNKGNEVPGNVDVTLPPHGRREITVGSAFLRPVDIAYIVFEADFDTVKGYTKFHNGEVYRAAVPAVKDAGIGDVYIPHIVSDPNWWTGISILNTTSFSKYLAIEFDNGETKNIFLSPHEHYAFTISDLFNGQAQPGIHSAIIRDAGGIMSLEVFESKIDNYLSSVILKDTLTTTIRYPHVTSTSRWWTGIAAYNTSDSQCDMAVISVSLRGTHLSFRTIPIDGHGKYIAMIQGLDFPTDTAKIKIESTSLITGLVIFGTNDGNQMAGYTSVGISSRSGIFPKLEPDGWTGVAFMNTENSPATVTLTAYNDSGDTITSKTMTLGPHARVVDTAENLFDSNLGNATYITYSSNRNIVGFQLDGSGDGMMLDALPIL